MFKDIRFIIKYQTLHVYLDYYQFGKPDNQCNSTLIESTDYIKAGNTLHMFTDCSFLLASAAAAAVVSDCMYQS